MMTTSAASMIVNALSWQVGPNDEPNQDAADVTHVPQDGRGYIMVRHVLRLLRTGASKASLLVPAAVKAHLAARADARHFAHNLHRLDLLSGHLLRDIGMEVLPSGELAFEESDPVEQIQVVPLQLTTGALPRSWRTQPTVALVGLSAA